ncbi:MAG: hypothetical protein HDT43_09725 [Ruminococcaceae bacterium]|nr:hypothetical protein [Oscillospiraceae bacterium]
MKTDDLFNAINDIDTQYITEAWNNTEPEADTMVIYESEQKPSKAKIFGFAAVFAALISAACLAVYFRVNEPRINIIQPDSSVSAVGSAGTSSAVTIDPLLAVRDMPIPLYGPDRVQIKYGDVTSVTLPDGKTVSAAEFDPDNWESVICDGFTYLATPRGLNYSSAEYSNSIIDDVLEKMGQSYSENDYGVNYRRVNVGDKFGDLTVKSATAIFHINSSGYGKLWQCKVEFEGEVTINACIICDKEIHCVPLNGERTLPVMSSEAYTDYLGYFSKAYFGEYLSGEFRYYSDYPAFSLNNVNGIWLQNVAGDNGYAAVKLKLSNIKMNSFTYHSKLSDSITADIEDIWNYSEERPEGSLPFDLIGLDGKQILFDDVTGIFNDKLKPIDTDRLTADNWYRILCDGMCYLGTPEGRNYNSIDNYYSFEDDGTFWSGYGDIIMHEYRRYDVGDSFDGLQITSAATEFYRTDPSDENKELLMAQKMQYSMVELDGQTKLNAYLTRDKDGNLSCIPLNGETSLPVLFPGTEGYTAKSYSGCFESADGTKLYYQTELPPILLNNANGLNLAEYFDDRDYIKVELTLENISLAYSRQFDRASSIVADIVGISDYNA